MSKIYFALQWSQFVPAGACDVFEMPKLLCQMRCFPWQLVWPFDFENKSKRCRKRVNSSPNGSRANKTHFSADGKCKRKNPFLKCQHFFFSFRERNHYSWFLNCNRPRDKNLSSVYKERALGCVKYEISFHSVPPFTLLILYANNVMYT